MQPRRVFPPYRASGFLPAQFGNDNDNEGRGRTLDILVVETKSPNKRLKIAAARSGSCDGGDENITCLQGWAKKVGPRVGEFCSCYSLPLLPQLGKKNSRNPGPNY